MRRDPKALLLCDIIERSDKDGLEFRNPLLMLPRRQALCESRNDNQVGTTRHFSQFGLFEVVESESFIPDRLNHMLTNLEE